MGTYIKLFNTHTDYSTYINSQDKVLPNVSYCEDENEVHYNPWYDPERFVAKFNVTSTSSPTILSNNPTIVKEIEVDGVILPNVVTSYTFATTGIHIVKYTLTDGTTSMNSGLFAGNSKIISITIPDTITTIDASSFGGCSNLKNVIIPSSVTTINGGLGSLNFENVIFNSINPNATFVRDTTNKVLTNIAGDTLICGFNNTIDIPNSVTTIGNIAFAGCSGLTSITIPNSVTSIGSNAFYGCSGLTSITIPNSVTSIGSDAFRGCTGLTSVTIPNNVTSIGQSAFLGCSGLTSITIPNNVTTIGANTFQNCTGLTSVTIPNSVTSIGNNAFYNCTGLTNVTIGSGVTSIGTFAFSHCSSLTSITSMATTAPTISNNTFKDIKTDGTLYVHPGSYNYDTWMGTGDYYLGKYNWTKVEQ